MIKYFRSIKSAYKKGFASGYKEAEKRYRSEVDKLHKDYKQELRIANMEYVADLESIEAKHRETEVDANKLHNERLQLASDKKQLEIIARKILANHDRAKDTLASMYGSSQGLVNQLEKMQ